MRRPVFVLALVGMVVLAGCAVGYQPTSDGSDRADPATDEPLGYYDGYWYNESLEIDATDGLSAFEEEAVLSRAMARVQVLRGLRFEKDIDIEVVTRAEFREEFDDIWREPAKDARTLDNAQYEALFLVGPDEDVVDVKETNRGGIVQGFYQPSTERIVIVSGNDPATLDDELTLAHELLHALQDQRFGLTWGHSRPLDATNARNGVVEGDAMVVETEYEQRCETGEWDCVDVETDSESSLSAEFHWGVYFVGYFPYAEGPSFIDHHRSQGGWTAIDEMYDAYPTTSAEIIRPETYGSDGYGEATLQDRSSTRWERVTVENGSDAATVGRAGLASMFAYTAYAGDSPGIVDRTTFRYAEEAEAPRYHYDVPYTEGWYGDRLLAYRHDDETAYVWNVTFNDRANATTFRAGYEDVLAHWDGQRRVDTADGTVWTFGDTGRFDGAIRVEQDGNAITVVKAPASSELGAVHAPVETAARSDASATAD